MLSRSMAATVLGAAVLGAVSKFIEPYAAVVAALAIIVAVKNKKANLAFLFYVAWIITYTLIVQAV